MQTAELTECCPCTLPALVSPVNPPCREEGRRGEGSNLGLYLSGRSINRWEIGSLLPDKYIAFRRDKEKKKPLTFSQNK